MNRFLHTLYYYYIRFFSWYPALGAGTVLAIIAYFCSCPCYTLFIFSHNFLLIVLTTTLFFLAGSSIGIYLYGQRQKQAALFLCKSHLITAILVLLFFIRIFPHICTEDRFNHRSNQTHKNLNVRNKKEESFTARKAIAIPIYATALVLDRRLCTKFGLLSWMVTFIIRDIAPYQGNSVIPGGIFSFLHNTTTLCYLKPPSTIEIGDIVQFTGMLEAYLEDEPVAKKGCTRYRQGAQTSYKIAIKPDWPSITLQGRNSFLYYTGEMRLYVQRMIELISATLFSADEMSRHVAISLTFGLPLSSELKYEIHRAGIDHVFAVSGFHFGIIAAAVAFFIRRLCKAPASAYAVIALTTIFLWIVGPFSPSVLRSWITIFVTYGSVLVYKKSSPLNSLGIALICVLFMQPSYIHAVGFQLSFIATCAILLISGPMKSYIEKRIFQKREQEIVAQFSWIDKKLYLVIQLFCVELFSLSISVWLYIIPYATLYLDGFPSIGIIYNLIIPPLFSCILVLSLAAFCCYPISLLCAQCFSWSAHILITWALYILDATYDLGFQPSVFVSFLFSHRVLTFFYFFVITLVAVVWHVTWKETLLHGEKKAGASPFTTPSAIPYDENWKSCL